MIRYINAIVFSLMLFASCNSSEKKEHVHGSMDMSNMVHLSDHDREMINLKTDRVSIKTIYETFDFPGVAAVDENAVTGINSRVNGRIDKLFLRDPGKGVKAGQPLYSIYSEELLSIENEYLLALRQEQSKNTSIGRSLIEASYQNLLQWGLTAGQIKTLSESKRASPYITFSSNVSGFISDLKVTEGQYVSIGTPLYTVSSLSKIWIIAEIYQNEYSSIPDNADLLIYIEGLADPVSGKTILNAPVVNPDKNVSSLIIEVNNHDGRIKPGMRATVSVKRKGKKTLVIPKTSLVLGKMTSVWVETATGMYENRMVETGIENKSEVEILSGLKLGERVVTSGSYLLNSAYILQNGANSMAGMEM
jgi:membrane fusion protein, copper/silver efflux system